MQDSPAPHASAAAAPTPVLEFPTRLKFVVALLASGVAAGGCVLPWFTVRLFDLGGISKIGVKFAEGIVQLILGGSCIALFLGVLIVTSPTARSRLALTASGLACGTALAPIVLILRGAWMGMKTILVIGEGYIGWSYGLYLSLAGGFLAAAFGCVAAGTITRRPKTVHMLRKKRPARQL